MNKYKNVNVKKENLKNVTKYKLSFLHKQNIQKSISFVRWIYTVSIF